MYIEKKGVEAWKKEKSYKKKWRVNLYKEITSLWYIITSGFSVLLVLIHCIGSQSFIVISTAVVLATDFLRCYRCLFFPFFRHSFHLQTILLLYSCTHCMYWVCLWHLIYIKIQHDFSYCPPVLITVSLCVCVIFFSVASAIFSSVRTFKSIWSRFEYSMLICYFASLNVCNCRLFALWLMNYEKYIYILFYRFTTIYLQYLLNWNERMICLYENEYGINVRNVIFIPQK